MSKKSAPLPKRPEPPSAEKILSDVKNAPLDDVVFALPIKDPFDGTDSAATTPEEDRVLLPPLKRTDSVPLPMPKRAQLRRTDSAPLQRTDSEESESSRNSNGEDEDIDMTYRKALEFIEISEKLRLAPSKLKTQREHLEKLSEELKISISELKSQATSCKH